MTNNEIIKALECLCGVALKCRECQYSNRYQFPLCRQRVAKHTLDLISRQQAEIERLKKILAEEEEKYKLCAKRFYKVGVKDFAEKLKSTYFIDSERLCCQVDKVFKEMVGDTE